MVILRSIWMSEIGNSTYIITLQYLSKFNIKKNYDHLFINFILTANNSALGNSTIWRRTKNFIISSKYVIRYTCMWLIFRVRITWFEDIYRYTSRCICIKINTISVSMMRSTFSILYSNYIDLSNFNLFSQNLGTFSTEKGYIYNQRQYDSSETEKVLFVLSVYLHDFLIFKVQAWFIIVYTLR